MYQVIKGRLRQSFSAASGEAVGLGVFEAGSYFGCARHTPTRARARHLAD
jgi:hypothetical protein